MVNSWLYPVQIINIWSDIKVQKNFFKHKFDFVIFWLILIFIIINLLKNREKNLCFSSCDIRGKKGILQINQYFLFKFLPRQWSVNQVYDHIKQANEIISSALRLEIEGIFAHVYKISLYIFSFLWISYFSIFVTEFFAYAIVYQAEFAGIVCSYQNIVRFDIEMKIAHFMKFLDILYHLNSNLSRTLNTTFSSILWIVKTDMKCIP